MAGKLLLKNVDGQIFSRTKTYLHSIYCCTLDTPARTHSYKLSKISALKITIFGLKMQFTTLVYSKGLVE